MTTTPHTVARGAFLREMAAGGLLLVAAATGCRNVQDDLRRIAGRSAPPTAGGPPLTPAVYLRIGTDGDATVIVHRSEMGQGIRTSLAMAVADDLEADWSRVHVEQAPGDEKTYGGQDTDGSHSIKDFLVPMREAGATGRVMLETAAAQQWRVPLTEGRAPNHPVEHTPTGRTLDYASLVPAARLLPVPPRTSLRLKPASEFRFLGKEIPGIDLLDMTTGRARYGIDQHMSGMKFAVVARPPVYGGTVATLDASAASRVPGVERIVALDHTPPPSGMQPAGGVAVIATSTWAAIQGRKALAITWHDGPNQSYESAAYRAGLEQSVRQNGRAGRKQGDAAHALSRAVRRVSASYYIPHLAHAPMEPVSALAHVHEGKCEVWAPTQNPQEARDGLAKLLGLPAENVRVNVTLLGGGFGRKSFSDFILEAALLSRAVGAPVKVVWTREDDLQHDFFHTVAAEHLEAGLDAHGTVTAWLHRSALPSIGSTFDHGVLYQDEGELAMGMTDLPYDIPNIQAEAGRAVAHTRIGWYRSVINIPHAFAIGSFIDELAPPPGKDPPGLLRGGIDVPAQKAGWGPPLPAGQGRGIAAHRSFLSYVASVVQVRVAPDGALVIPRVDIAIDAGFIAHPERVRAQLEGATIMGLGNALSSEITFAAGRVVQSNFDSYHVMRMDASPREIHVHIVPSDAPPGGVGEPGVPPTAPALCNAIFAATGRRSRDLPVGNQLAKPEHPAPVA